jgi:DNA-binding GntR family transcriptional regulator
VNRRPEATDLEHRLIYEAVVAGDAVRVEDLVATHLSSGFDMVIQMVADHPGL